MRRLFIVAMLIGLPWTLGFAQRGGGHGGGGHVAMSSGGHGFAGGGHASFAGASSRIGFASSSHRLGGFRAGGLRASNGFGRTFRGSRFGSRFNRRFRGYPWAYWGYYGDPRLYDDYYNDQSYYQPDSSSYDSYDQANVATQDEVDRFRDEISDLQDERDYRNFKSRPSSSDASPTADINAGTVFVFQDKHVEEVQNYAIVGKTVWIFNQQRTSKIPLSELDIPATTKANDERGVDFQLPAQKT